MDKPLFVAITGTNHYYGSDFFKIGLVMQLVKDRGNPHDDEAIRAEIPPIGKVGYVANSSFSVPRGCRSAGRLYDTFDDVTLAVVRFVVKDTVIVEVVKSMDILQIVHTTNENSHGGDYLPGTVELPPVRDEVIYSTRNVATHEGT